MRQTKLVVPPAAAGSFIARERLEALAQRALEVPITIVRGGGGYGKSTLLRAWARRLEERARIAWLSLEPYDASLVAVVEAVNASFAHALGDIGSGVARLLERGEEQAHRLAAALSNELLAWTEERETEVVLFIDDVQFVAEEQSALTALGAIIDALPPRVHVVCASRVPLRFAPLAKLRAAGALLEVDQSEMRFTPDETSQLIAGEAALTYHDKTEGWPIAVGLLAQMHRRDPSRPEMVLRGSRESIFEFLAEEVIERLPGDAIESLYALAVPDTIEATIAAHFLDVDRIAPNIARLEEYGLYFTRVDAETWRLHGLFREYLLERLRERDPERLRKLRTRYAELLRESGRKMEALHQLLDAGVYEHIVQYATEAAMAIRLTDRYRQFIRILSRVPEEQFIKRPMLHRLYSLALLRDHRVDAALEQLRLCFDRAMASGEASTACIAQIDQGIQADDFTSLLRHQYLRSEVHFRKALELAQSEPLRGDPRFLLYAQWHLGMLHACRGEFETAFAHFAVAEQIELRQEQHYEIVIVEISILHGWHGNWKKALDYAELAEELFRSGGGEIQLGRAFLAQARALRVLGVNPRRAWEAARLAVDELRKAEQEEELPLALTTLALASADVGEFGVEDARAMLKEADAYLRRYPNRSYEFEVALARVELSFVVRDEGSTREDVETLRKLALTNDDPWQQGMAFLAAGLRQGSTSERAGSDALRLAASRLGAVGDRYHEMIARAALLAGQAQSNLLRDDQFREFMKQIRAAALEHVFHALPSHALSLFTWALQHGITDEHTAVTLSAAAHPHISALLDLSRDASLGSEARSIALRSAARIAPSAARATVASLQDDADLVVASAARTLLTFLPAPEVPELRIGVVGSLSVSIGDQLLSEGDEQWGRKRAAELLRYLAIADTSVTKDAIIEALWPDNPAVLDTTFRVTLHQLRRALQPNRDGAGDYVEYDGTVLRLRPEVVGEIDVRAGSAAIKRAQLRFARAEYDAASVDADAAIEIFTRAPREETVDDWLRPHVRRWRELAINALRLRASIAHACGDRALGASLLERALGMDALNEDLIVQLLDELIALGKAEIAKVIFSTYRRRLQEQVGVSPGPAVMERYSGLLARGAGVAVDDRLSDREREVVMLIGRGLSNKEIASELGLSVWTINNHVAKVLKKLGVASRAGAVAAVASRGDG